MKKTEIKFQDGTRAILNHDRGSLVVVETEDAHGHHVAVAIALDDAAAMELADALTVWANQQRHERRLGISHRSLTDLAKCEPEEKRGPS